MRKSFVVRLFAALLVTFFLLLAVSDVGIYMFARQSIGEEFIRLNQASLSQAASQMGKSMELVSNLGMNVSVNSKILQLITRSDEQAEKDIHTILTGMMNEFNSSKKSVGNMLEVYVLGRDNLRASAFNSTQFSWESLEQDPRCAALFQGETDVLILPTTANKGGSGLMGYSFQIVRVMRDLLSNEARGIVVLDISELFLFSEYRSYLGEDVFMMVIESDGTVVSGKNKSNIGFACGYNEDRLKEMSAAHRVDHQIADGYFLLYEPIPGCDWLLIEQMSVESIFSSLTQVRSVIFITLFICTMLIAIALIIASRSILIRVARIEEKMGEVADNDLTVRLPVIRNDEFGRIESTFNIMVEDINRLVQQVRSSEREKRIAEMDFLHAQINSHFIHNTLTSIRFMLDMNKVQEAGEMIFYFSKLLRQTLSRSAEFIPLRDELGTLYSYVALQKYRYQNAFEVSYEVAEDVMDTMVPALLLQPVVENAIFHGVGREYRHIQIQGYKQGADLILIVADDGAGMPEEVCRNILRKDAQLNRVGLRNVYDRIRLNYGADYGLSIESQPGKGTIVTMTLPVNLSEQVEEGDTL